MSEPAMIHGIPIEEIAEMLESYKYAIADCTPRLDARCERFHYIPRIEEIVESLRAEPQRLCAEVRAARGEGVAEWKQPLQCHCCTDRDRELCLDKKVCQGHATASAAAPSAAVTVTDAMVKRAIDAYREALSQRGVMFGDSHRGMRAALEAALAADQVKPVAGE